MERYTADPAAAKEVAGDRDSPDRAAWALVANALLNLDETVTKE